MVWYRLYVESENIYSIKELIYKTNTVTDVENKLFVTKGENREG